MITETKSMTSKDKSMTDKDKFSHFEAVSEPVYIKAESNAIYLTHLNNEFKDHLREFVTIGLIVGAWTGGVQPDHVPAGQDHIGLGNWQESVLELVQMHKKRTELDIIGEGNFDR